MSFGPDFADATRHLIAQVDHVLKGAKAGTKARVEGRTAPDDPRAAIAGKTVTLAVEVPRFSSPRMPGTMTVEPLFVMTAEWVSEVAGSASALSTVRSRDRAGTIVGGATVRLGREQAEP